jgi:hypothetical protein
MKKLAVTLVVLGAFYSIYSYFSKPWQLSLYGDGVTLMRLNYDSKESCLSAGNSYYRDGSTQYKRFDCGYKCDGDKNDLIASQICSPVCDNYGCK